MPREKRMLVEEYLNMVEAAPKLVQKMLTRLAELEEEPAGEKRAAEAEMRQIKEALRGSTGDKGLAQSSASLEQGEVDKQLQRINKSYLKILDMDKKRIEILSNLLQQLEEASELMKEGSADFREGVAKETLAKKLDAVAEMLEQKVEAESCEAEEEDKVYCACRRPVFGEMVVCDNPDCPIEWYHCSCVGLKAAPRKRWVCPTCTKAAGDALRSPPASAAESASPQQTSEPLADNS